MSITDGNPSAHYERTIVINLRRAHHPDGASRCAHLRQTVDRQPSSPHCDLHIPK
jgi:hypothetical protein